VVRRVCLQVALREFPAFSALKPGPASQPGVGGQQLSGSRSSSAPSPEPVELGEMVEWSLFLGAAFSNVVERVSASPAFELDNSFIYRELDESTIPETFPSEIAELFFMLLKNEKVVFCDLDRVDVVVKRIAGLGAPRPRLLEVCDQLARLGYAEAAALHDSLA
jgi:Domain of unknown function (DUF4020)